MNPRRRNDRRRAARRLLAVVVLGIAAILAASPPASAATTATFSNGVLTVLDVQLVDSSYNSVPEPPVTSFVQVEGSLSNGNAVLVLAPAIFQKSGPVSVNLTDAAGRIVFEKENITNERIFLNEKKFAPAVYFYKIVAGSEVLGKGKIVFQ